MYPEKQCTPLGPVYITARDQSMVESGVTEEGEHRQLSTQNLKLIK